MLYALIILMTNPSPTDFDKYAPLAQAVEFCTGIPASVQLSQAYCETRFGIADTIGTLYNNIFSIMDLEGDEWEGENGPHMDCCSSRNFIWRKYGSHLHSWLDYAQYMQRHHSHRFKTPVHTWKGYGRKIYWKVINKTINEFNLRKYDLWQQNLN